MSKKLEYELPEVIVDFLEEGNVIPGEGGKRYYYQPLIFTREENGRFFIEPSEHLPDFLFKTLGPYSGIGRPNDVQIAHNEKFVK